ncbi:MFS transporter [Halochromatium salexigens]|uniref:MFS transporter n=1 Tax=Halochromatium salexigens TaxID=49447 RepID=UPI0030B81799
MRVSNLELLSGPLIDRFGARRLLPWHLTPLLLALLALALADGPWLAPLYLGLAGLGMGLANSLMSVIWGELYGSTHLGAIRSLAQSAMIFATAVAPVSVGLLTRGLGCLGELDLEHPALAAALQ